MFDVSASLTATLSAYCMISSSTKTFQRHNIEGKIKHTNWFKQKPCATRDVKNHTLLRHFLLSWVDALDGWNLATLPGIYSEESVTNGTNCQAQLVQPMDFRWAICYLKWMVPNGTLAFWLPKREYTEVSRIKNSMLKYMHMPLRFLHVYTAYYILSIYVMNIIYGLDSCIVRTKLAKL